MKKTFVCVVLAVMMGVFAVGCGSASESDASGEAATSSADASASVGEDENAASGSTQEEADAESAEDALTVLLSGKADYQKALAKVLLEEQETYGRPSFPLSNISRARGLAIACAMDLDGDDEEELITIHEDENSKDSVVHVMEIWTGKGGNAKCLYSGSPQNIGADNRGLDVLEDEEGQKYIRYDDYGTMNGVYIGHVEDGSFVQDMGEDETQEGGYDSAAGMYVIGDRQFKEVCTYVLYCYCWGEETDEYVAWKTSLKEVYNEALAAFGLEKSDGSAIYSAGVVSSLMSDEYLLVKETVVDPYGEVTAVKEYDYDEEGRQIRTYRNDILIHELTYDDAGNLLYDVAYNEKGGPRSEYRYDADGKELETIEYNDGAISEHYIYTYDENGNLITKAGESEYFEYQYDEDGFLARMDEYDEGRTELREYHTYECDEQGRIVKDVLHRDDMDLLFETFAYESDGSYKDSLWYFVYFDENADTVYQPGAETLQKVSCYDAEGQLIREEEYTFPDFGSKETTLHYAKDYERNDAGKILKSFSQQYSEGELEYEITGEQEWTEGENPVLVNNKVSFRGYSEAYVDEFSYLAAEGEVNENGYLIHRINRRVTNIGSGEAAEVTEEHYYLYQNALGDLQGIDY